MQKLKKFLLDIFFPLECLGCQKPGLLLCEECFRGLEFSDPNKSFLLATPFITKTFIAGDYDNPLLAKLIKKFKYNFLSSLGAILSRWLILFWGGQLALINYSPDSINSSAANSASTSPEQIINTKTLSQLSVVPIPLSKKRIKWRGFNQAELLARPFCTAFNYPLCLELKRLKHKTPQAELNQDERRLNIKDNFVWAESNPPGENILLIDDVATTGATLNEAARVLKEAGAKNVYALVLAKG